MYYVLFYKTVDNYVERRKPFRDEHLKLAMEAYNNGYIVMAGALVPTDEVGTDEALLVFKGDSPAVAEAFALNDPYVKNGLITKWTVRLWTVVIGGE